MTLNPLKKKHPYGYSKPYWYWFGCRLNGLFEVILCACTTVIVFGFFCFFYAILILSATPKGASPVGIALVICGSIVLMVALVGGMILTGLHFESKADRMSALATAKVQAATAQMQLDNLRKANQSSQHSEVERALTVRSMIEDNGTY